MTPLDLLIFDNFIVIFIQGGNMIGLKDNDNGQIGTIEIEWTSLYMIGPPADKK